MVTRPAHEMFPYVWYFKHVALCTSQLLACLPAPSYLLSIHPRIGVPCTSLSASDHSCFLRGTAETCCVSQAVHAWLVDERERAEGVLPTCPSRPRALGHPVVSHPLQPLALSSAAPYPQMFFCSILHDEIMFWFGLLGGLFCAADHVQRLLLRRRAVLGCATIHASPPTGDDVGDDRKYVTLHVPTSGPPGCFAGQHVWIKVRVCWLALCECTHASRQALSHPAMRLGTVDNVAV